MPILVPKGLPAYSILKDENVFVMHEEVAERQDIRPIDIAIVNLMPIKEVTETQLIRMLANTPLQVSLHLLTMGSHESRHTDRLHMESFYDTFDEIRNRRFDGMIITGAPVEFLPFEDVDYWDELSNIMAYTTRNVFSTMHICWGAQAGLYFHYGIDKHVLPEKIFGVFSHRVCKSNSQLMRGFDELFFAPHSRHTQIRRDDVLRTEGLDILAESDEAGLHIVATPRLRRIFVQGHSEYERDTLKLEYERDLGLGLVTGPPRNYFRGDSGEVVVNWSGHGNLFFANWLNYVYQETFYDLSMFDSLDEGDL
ncbi:MAG: homoserine O-succinyltransferase [Clostridiales Family XIII bacterium]|jgi:homoserine O-succinyltransferase|nr:homoserine O-succinyltransferase [Clostridiales Family XIII bacterium]